MLPGRRRENARACGRYRKKRTAIPTVDSKVSPPGHSTSVQRSVSGLPRTPLDHRRTHRGPPPQYPSRSLRTRPRLRRVSGTDRSGEASAKSVDGTRFGIKAWYATAIKRVLRVTDQFARYRHCNEAESSTEVRDWPVQRLSLGLNLSKQAATAFRLHLRRRSRCGLAPPAAARRLGSISLRPDGHRIDFDSPTNSPSRCLRTLLRTSKLTVI
jgi:hypothetical protein